MSERKNQGFLITDSIHIEDVEFVLGESTIVPDNFVTWEYSEGSNFYWGHYFSDRLAAKHDLLERANRELQYRERMRERAAEIKTKERER